MTTLRRLLVCGLLSGLLVLGAGAWLLWPRPGITRANAVKIQPGMTLAAVEAILDGRDRDDASDGPLELDDPVPTQLTQFEYARFKQEAHADTRRVRRWRSDDVTIHVDFDAEEHVLVCRLLLHHRVAACPLDILRRWLRL